ncbi:MULTISPECIES: hypothetical protein [unclassified Pseudomonas]|uniref:hypothetical protein n=1 Tax=unclassified Pseudomonas TaxID=196821 RepID=UPI000838A8C9|nr:MULTISPECIES: hypothetical protein [unclassified Pseudomonas]AZC21723.1 hypothetical protein C4K39_0009 [Pseudomonas sessilinigenes]QIH05336.1 hypothetical protein ATY02_01015 [Pseudomonas sp. BIOMIG1BAC]
MGNMSGAMDMGWKKFSERADLAKLVALSLAAFLSVEASSKATAVPVAPHYELPVQRYFSPSVNQVGFSDSRGFAPATAPLSTPSVVYQDQQRWVF